MEDAVTGGIQLAEYGILGVFVLMLCTVVVYLWRESKAERATYLAQIQQAHQARIDDAKAVQTQMLDLIKQCTSALQSVASTLDQQIEATRELRDTLKDFGDDLRNRNR